MITFIDTSVLCELVAVPGKSSDPGTHLAELDERFAAGERFVIPVTAVIETGNHIAQAKTGDRRAAARRLVELLLEAVRRDGRIHLKSCGGTRRSWSRSAAGTPPRCRSSTSPGTA